MNVLGILRASALCLLVSAFQGQPVSCGILNRILSSKKSSNAKVSEKPKDSTVKSQKSVPEPEYGLVFKNSTWDDSMLASSVLFLKQFCREVVFKTGVWDGVSSETTKAALSEVCLPLSRDLGLLIDLFKAKYGPGTVAERKEIEWNIYEGVLKAENFGLYAEWLKTNIPNIQTSLKSMHDGALPMSKKQLETDTSAGPLKYGFVFRYGWWERGAQTQLGRATANILRDLNNTNKFIDSFLKIPEKSTAESQVAEAAEQNEPAEAL